MKRRGFLAAILAAIPPPWFARKPIADSDHNCEWLNPDPCPYYLDIAMPSRFVVSIMSMDTGEILSQYTIELPARPVG